MTQTFSTFPMVFFFVIMAAMLVMGCSVNPADNKGPDHPNPEEIKNSSVVPVILSQTLTYPVASCYPEKNDPNAVISGSPFIFHSDVLRTNVSKIQGFLLGDETAMKFGITGDSLNPSNLTVPGEVTNDLKNGTYYIFFVFPSKDGRFALSTNVPNNPDIIVDKNGNPVINLSFVKRGSITGEDAAGFIDKAITSAGEDEQIEKMTMNVSEAWIRINPIGDHGIGNTFLISGTTNIPEGNEIIVSINPADYIPTPSDHETGDMKYSVIKVEKGVCGANTWTLGTFDKTRAEKESYRIFATAVLQHADAVQEFNITDFVPAK